VNVLETTLLKERVRGIGQVVADAGHGSLSANARTQVSVGAEELFTVGLLRKRVHGGVALAENVHLVDIRLADLELESLTFGGRLNQLASDLERGTHFAGADVLKVGHITRYDNLN